MRIYQRRDISTRNILRGKEQIYVSSYKDLMEELPTIDLEKQVLCIDELAIIPEEFYVFGNQTPYNRYGKHAEIVMLNKYARNAQGIRVPFYRQRREAFTELNRQRNERKKQDDYGLMYYSGLGWKPGGIDQVTRFLTIVSAFKGLESFLCSYHKRNPTQKIRVRPEYSPKSAWREGSKVYFGMPSITGVEYYTMEKNALHNIAFMLHPYMHACMSRIKSTHNCGRKENSRMRFGSNNRHIMVEPLCEHDVAAFLQFLYEYQARFRAGEKLDSIWDPVEKTRATIPMFLNPIPLATPEELHDFRVVYHNTVIRRPKRDKAKGGFLRDSEGKIIYDTWKPLWEEEIEPIMWTRISDLGRDAMFVRQRIIDLPFFE